MPEVAGVVFIILIANFVAPLVALVVLVPDDAKDQWERVSVAFPRGTYGLDPDGTAEQRTPTHGMPVLYVKESALAGGAMTGGAEGTPPARFAAAIFTDS